MSDFKERLQNEANELNERCMKLQDFITSDAYEKLDERNQGLLAIQFYAMQTYLRILQERIFVLDIQVG